MSRKRDTVVVVRKIQVLVDTEDAEEVNAVRQKIYGWQEICFRAANYICTHQFVQDRIRDFVYLTEEVRLKLSETSRENTTYQMLSAMYKGQIPMNMMASLNHSLVQQYNAERNAYWSGQHSLRNYKKGLGLPVPPSDFKLSRDEKSGEYKMMMYKLRFRTYLGRDRDDKHRMLARALAGRLKMGVGYLKPDKGRFYYYATFHIDKEQHELDESVIAEASLSLEVPVTVKIGKEQFQIGTKEEFLHRRLAIQAARRRAQMASPYNRGGKGRKRSMKAVEHYRDLETDYIQQKLHLYSRKLIDLCVKYRAATLLLVNQQAKEDLAKEDEFLLRNWGYSGLKEKIAYKAERAGIEVIEE